MTEDKIDKLIAAIETLAENISKGVKAEEAKKEKAAEELAERVAFDQVHDLSLKLVRKDPINNMKINEIFADHGGEVIEDIKGAKSWLIAYEDIVDIKKAMEAI
jgi:hypothetical protein